jgi:rare lipoprotein A (peptidoglycan hydrolase)
MKTILVLLLGLTFSSFTFTTRNVIPNVHTATWYDTSGHPKVHREHSTAAYNNLPLHTKLVVTNLSNNKTDTVEVTDRMGNKSANRIDLCKKSFGKLSNHKVGVIKVTIVPLK